MFSKPFTSQTKKTTLTIGISIGAAELHLVAVDCGENGVVLGSVTSFPFDPQGPLDKQISSALSAFEKKARFAER